MPGFNPEKINIHELAIEEPEKQAEQTFDPERDITPDDWDKIYEDIRHDRKGWYLFNVKILDPTFTISAANLSSLKRDLWRERKANNWGEFMTNATFMRIFNSQSDLELDDTARSSMESVLHTERGNDWTLAYRAMEMKIIDPNFEIDPEDWESLKKSLQKLTDEIDFVKQIMKMRIINPDWKPEIDSSIWEKCKGALDTRRTNFMDNFVDAASAMKIAAAEKVELRGNGLEIIMPDKKLDPVDAPQLPEQRSF